MSSVLAKTYEATNRGIHNAVEGLRDDLTLEKELFRDCAHAALIVAAHTGTLKTLLVWCCEIVERKWS